MVDTIVRGDSELYDIPLVDRDGAPLSLLDTTVWVTCKTSTDQVDAEALWQHHIAIDAAGDVTSQDGLYLGTGGVAAGIVVERISPEESALFVAGDYVLDVQVRYPSPDVPGQYDIETPILGDPVSVVLDITQATEIAP